MTKYDVVDLFAGTGWGVACKELGLREAGVEIMPEALESRKVAGMDTIYSDVWDGLLGREEVPEHRILLASPPCQTFSQAGTGTGRKNLEQVLEIIEEERYKDPQSLLQTATELGDERTALVLSPLSHIWDHRPEFVALEQVTPVLPVWEASALHLERMGYSVATGVLDAQYFGAAQVRKRAYLVARRDGREASLPEQTTPTPKTMFEELGWGLTERPSPTITSHLGVTRSPTGTQQVYLDAIDRGKFVFKDVRPKPSSVARNGIGSKYAPNTVNISSEEGAVLQTYPREFPFQGKKTMIDLQIGNAVPPKVAAEVLKMFL